MQFDFIVAVDSKWGIAKNSILPWKGLIEGHEDLMWFMKQTKTAGSAVIMGRKTWESIPEKYRPLKSRINIVVSGSTELTTVIGGLTTTPVVYVKSFQTALDWCADAKMKKYQSLEHIWVIGGNTIYEQALRSPYLRYGYVTMIRGDFHCDQRFPQQYLKGVQFVSVNTASVCVNAYRKYDFTNYEEIAYKNLLYSLVNAPVRLNRTLTPTRGRFHEVLKFNLYESGRGRILPLLTLKSTPWKSIYHEMIWFLRGSTDTDYLKENGVPIWDGNSTREFLDSRGLTEYETGELGPIYGYQWRHWNETYWNKATKAAIADGKVTLTHHDDGIDQIAKVIQTLKTDPWNRRMIVSAWNVEQLPEMSLPPCFLAGTPVRTKHGYIPIESVVLRQELYNSKGVYEPVNQVHVTDYSGPVHYLKVSGYPDVIRATPRHPMYCQSGDAFEWRELKDVKPGDKIGVVINQLAIIPSFVAISGNQYKKVETSIPLDNPAVWYMLGHFVGDGWLDWKDNKKYRSYFVFNERDMIQSFPIINTISPLSEVKTPDHCTGCRKFEMRKRFWWTIFKDFGHGANNKTIPEWVHNAPVEFVNQFLRGYWDADGHDTGDRLTATTVSESLAFGIQALLLKVGKPALLSKQKRPHTAFIQGREVNQRDTYMIYYPKSEESRVCTITPGCAWYTVASNTTLNMEHVTVYNFDVGVDHTYTVGNLITHNCHYSFQFHVDPSDDMKPKYLNCLVNMRSADVALGVPFNIASYAFLTHVISYITGLIPGTLSLSMADCHVYENHLDGIKTILAREPRRFPTISFGPAITSNSSATIDDFTKKFAFSDYLVSDYKPHSFIKLPMAV